MNAILRIGQAATLLQVTTKSIRRWDKAGKIHCFRTPGFQKPQIFRDIGIGLNTKRRGFSKLYQATEFGDINHVVLTYPDRLTRFGFQYLERYFASHGAIIEIINRSTDFSLEQELVQDLIVIITSFSGRVHDLRSARA